MNKDEFLAQYTALPAAQREMVRKLTLERGIDFFALPIVRRPPDIDALPLSFAQQRLWFLDQLEPGNAFYNMPVAVRLRGALDADALQRSFEQVVARHEAL